MDIRGFEVVSAFEEQNINLPTRKTTESAGYDIEIDTTFQGRNDVAFLHIR